MKDAIKSWHFVSWLFRGWIRLTALGKWNTPVPSRKQFRPADMLRQVIIVGGGEHARVVAEAILARGELNLLGFVDSIPAQALVPGVSYLGRDKVLDTYPDCSLVLGFGTAPQTLDHRRELVGSLGTGKRWAVIVHPTAYVAPSAHLGSGAVVLPHAVVHTYADVGAHVIVNTGAVVEHEVVVGAYAQLGPCAVVGGGAIVGEAAFIGMGAVVRDHRRIGAGAVVGMGAVVVGDVPDGCCVLGVPARVKP